MKKIILLALSGNALVAHAQVGITNSGNLQIHTGVSVTGFAAFSNNASAAFVNNGTVYLRADITNDQASMAAGTGTLHLDGNSLQTISGSQTFRTFDLLTNNAAGIVLNNNLSVSGTHTFTAGMITTSSTPNYMIYEAGSSYSGSADSRHVNGWVRKSGSTNFIFPVGNATYERPVELTNLSGSSEFDARHNGAVTPNYGSVFNPIVLVDTSEYWTINRISGSAAAQVTMNWNTSKIPFPVLQLSHIRATYYDGTFWRNIGGSASGNVLTTGSVTSGSTNIFNTNFVIGSISHVLPLQIIYFTAGRSTGYTRINYSIGNELNVDHYEIEKSDDGINFHTLAVQTAFNRGGTEFYSYDDNSALRGTAWYRLKVTEFSTRVRYSAVVSVTDKSKALYVVKNPVDESIEVYAGYQATGVYSYTITSSSGQRMQAGILEIKQPGITSIRLQSRFASGPYMLVMKNKEISLQQLILKN